MNHPSVDVDSDDFDFVQIDQASRGCISGNLKEWPALATALQRRGINLPSSTRCSAVKMICRLICEPTTDEKNSFAEVEDLILSQLGNPDAIILTKREVDAIRSDPDALEALADWHDVQATLAQPMGYDDAVRNHIDRREEFRQRASIMRESNAS